MYEEAFQNLFKSYLFFAGSLETVIGMEGEGVNRKKRFYSEEYENVVWGSGCLVKIPWDSCAYMRVVWKLLNTFEYIWVKPNVVA